MLSLVRRYEVFRPLISNAVTTSVENAGGGVKNLNRQAMRFISTSDCPKHSDKLSKSRDTVGKLPTDLMAKRRMKKTCRTLTTLQNHWIPLATRVSVSKDEGRDFMAMLPDLVRDLIEIPGEHKCDDANNWFEKVLLYNLPRGKKNRGLLTVSTYKQLVEDAQLTPENIKLAQYLGWCIELLQSFFIISDDIVDSGTTRRDQPCWHRVNNVGLIAVNDALSIECSIYSILKKHFSHLDCYVDLMDLFHDITLITNRGQSMDLLTSKKNVTSFTMETYKSIAAYKTAYYSFYLPFASAMHLAGIKDDEIFRQSKTILLEMGHFFQVQDDFLDCFGDIEITGKVGTDIEQNKCTWLAVVCMQRANEETKAIMSECYGYNDPVKVGRVKELYKELGLPNTYASYEKDSYNMIKTHIQQTSRGVPHKIFLDILNKIYHRHS